MAASPHLKIYDSKGIYQAATKEAEAAAALVAFYGNGATIRDGHRVVDVVWTEGQERIPAFESYDTVAEIVNHRRNLRFATRGY